MNDSLRVSASLFLPFDNILKKHMMLSSDVAVLSKMLPKGCPVCGASSFSFQKVLWNELIDEWQLSPEEALYINVQQGFSCNACQNNLRSMTLARAICLSQGFSGNLQDWTDSPGSSNCKILEINEAGLLTKYLNVLEGHILVNYPQSDIHALPFSDDNFDLVVHSDTLEHVANPIHAIAECRRILKVGGTLAFTIPIVIGRMSRSRAGLAPSYHGAPQLEQSDYDVKTEFGADSWSLIIDAGFHSTTIHTDIFPASIAFTARK